VRLLFFWSYPKTIFREKESGPISKCFIVYELQYTAWARLVKLCYGGTLSNRKRNSKQFPCYCSRQGYDKWCTALRFDDIHCLLIVARNAHFGMKWYRRMIFIYVFTVLKQHTNTIETVISFKCHYIIKDFQDKGYGYLTFI